jgi:hypothetical protein
MSGGAPNERLSDFSRRKRRTAKSNGVRSQDGGATWVLMSGYPSCPVIYGMDFRDTLVGLAGGDRVSTTDGGPGIFKTTDAGVTWVRKFAQSTNDVLWLNDTTAIAIVGTSIYRSTNSGDTWSQISSQIFTGFDEMTLLPDTSVSTHILIGDTTGDKTVNSSDVTQTKSQVGLPVTGSNFREDVKANGAINASDVGQVRANLGHTIP